MNGARCLQFPLLYRRLQEPGTDFVRLKVKDTHVELLFPAVDVNVSVTQSEFRQYLRMLLCPRRSGILVAASNGQVQFHEDVAAEVIIYVRGDMFTERLPFSSGDVKRSGIILGARWSDLQGCAGGSRLLRLVFWRVVGGLDRGCKAAHCYVWIRGAT